MTPEPSGPSDCRTKDCGARDSIAANLSPHSEEKTSAVQERPTKRVVLQR